MAIQQKQVGQFTDENGSQATIGYDYDDVSLLVVRIIVDNLTTRALYVEAKRASGGGQTYSSIFQPNVADAPSVITIGSTQATRLQLTTTPSGKLDGVEWAARFS